MDLSNFLNVVVYPSYNDDIFLSEISSQKEQALRPNKIM